MKSMPINILYIIDRLGYGGTEKQLVQLIRNLDQDKFRPHLCTLKASEGLYEEPEIPRISLDFVSFAHPSIVTKVMTLSSFIRQHEIHIVQTFFQDPFLLGAMVKPFNKVKLIGSFRDLGFWRTPSETRKMKMAYPCFSSFMANSQAVKDHFVQVDGINSKKIEVIYTGVDLEAQPEITDKSPQNTPVVGIVANINRPVKRVQDFIRAAALVRKARPEVKFVIVGDGHLRAELESLSLSLGLGRTLSFMGRVENPLEVVRKFHVGVITSETEGFCNAILEYMACGVPVVATATGGNFELVREGDNGFLVPVGNVVLMAAKIELLLQNYSLHKHISDMNLARVLSEFSLPQMVTRQQLIYDRISKE
jgi:glycosyltransferase involved in cell wall biosynthesis